MAVVFEKVLTDGRFEVVDLDCADRNEAFEVMNIRHPDHYCGRSMSVGDIVMEGNYAWVCRPTSWTSLCDISVDAYNDLLASLDRISDERNVAHGS
jgi:hypothetical protein